MTQAEVVQAVYLLMQDYWRFAYRYCPPWHGPMRVRWDHVHIRTSRTVQ